MDEAVALVVAAPAIALALWAVAFIGGRANGEARAAVAAELAAQAALGAVGNEASATSERVALGATLSACTRTASKLTFLDAGKAAAVAVVCDVPGPLPGNQVCFGAYAQLRPAVSQHAQAHCNP